MLNMSKKKKQITESSNSISSNSTITKHDGKIVSELSHSKWGKTVRHFKKRIRKQSSIVWFGVIVALLIVVLIVYVSYEGERDIGPPVLFLVHLSFGSIPGEMMVTWHKTTSTSNDVIDVSTIKLQYGISEKRLSQSSNPVISKLESINLLTFRALMDNLKENTLYYYQVRGKNVRSEIFEFTTIKLGAFESSSILIYGDLGVENARSLPLLIGEVSLKDGATKNKVNAIFHLGNIGFALHTNGGEQGNRFLAKIEPIATRVPYMTCPGKSESFDNFSHYDARFSMLGTRVKQSEKKSKDKGQSEGPRDRVNNHFYSVNIGPVHVVVFSTEFYYRTEYGWEQIEKQYEFLERDLRGANRDRHKRPWIVTMGHRPMYCLVGADRDSTCSNKTLERKDIRKGVYWENDHQSSKIHSRLFGLEELFYWYGVDIQFYGHDHLYMRTLPIYKHRMRLSKQTDGDPYRNPNAPIHVITGIAGSSEHTAKLNDIPEWIGYHSLEYGYTRLKILGRYHLLLEQVSAERNGSLVDSFTITKDNPNPAWLTDNKRRKR